ncbi:hypothetical protein [Bradyrhizobium sp.]|jgi:hypothetical protein|uniref:hypothetical protein n=1 Tax=Bradyrhizobium sp. TaxID=376 RepID=UPI002D5891FC|nr:hypothetical protein [Bradyrhizobium sp.]HZR74185.1 hypothetical protein [Bradyrhizobium sp.]
MVIRKPTELPPAVAYGFVSAMNDYFAEEDDTKRDAIAAHQLKILSDYQNPQDKPLRLSDVAFFP